MKVIVNDLALQYTDEGDGLVILMLHGWKESLHAFDAYVSPLSKSYRVVRLDLPGFGGSEMPKTTWSLDDYVWIVALFIAKLELDVEILVGHSMGGRIALKGVANNSLRPAGLVVIATACLARQRTLRNKMLTIVAKVGKAVSTVPPFSWYRPRLRRALYDAVGSDYFAAGSLKNTYLQIIREDLRDAASKVTVPTLIIWGRDDTITPVGEGEMLRDCIKGSELYVIDHAGHDVPMEKPHEVLKLVLDNDAL
jgi:pimeloyl-ACP methyl ester carboxylesterase